MRAVYVIGYPGSGKSTTVAAALAPFGPGVQYDAPVPHVRYAFAHDGVWQVGRVGRAFPGTDALSMGINPHAVRWVQSIAADAGPGVLVGEGDRLANRAFLDACPDLTLVLVDTPLAEAQRRMAERAARLGRERQGASWWKGRATKVDNLAAAYPVVRIGGPLDTAASALRSILNAGT